MFVLVPKHEGTEILVNVTHISSLEPLDTGQFGYPWLIRLVGGSNFRTDENGYHRIYEVLLKQSKI